MDRLMSFFAGISKEKYPNADMNKPGSGAAGGPGFAFCRKEHDAAAEQVFRLILSFREEE